MSTVAYLLESSIPTIRYLTLTRLLHQPMADAQVTAAFQEIQNSAPVTEILARQSQHGDWEGERSYYTPKYYSTHWSMMLLAELHIDGANPSFRRGAEFMLNATREDLLHRLSGGIAEMECLYGNIMRYVALAGYATDERALPLLEYLVFSARQRWACPINANLSCGWGAARTLWGLSAVKDSGLPGVAEAIERGLEFLLADFSLITANYPAYQDRVSPIWFKLNFPLFYQADILFVLRVLQELGQFDHPGVRPALDWLAARRLPSGHFQGSSPFRARTYAGIGSVQETNRWVTLQAELVLRGIGNHAPITV